MAERRGAYRGRIELAIVTTAKYFVPMLLVRFRKKFPKIEIGLRVHNREAILQLLARNEVDLIMMGRVPDEIECVAAPFATNPLGVVSAPDHPLSRRRNIDLRALKDQDFVARERGSGTRLAMERLFAKHRVKPRIIMEIPRLEMNVIAARMARGAGTDRSASRREITEPRVASRVGHAPAAADNRAWR